MVKWWVEGIGPLEVLAECEGLYQLPVTDIPGKHTPQLGPVWARPSHSLPKSEPSGYVPQSGVSPT